MKIVVLGTRGVPDIPGGVEAHCQALYPRLVKRGFDVTVITRRSYVKNPAITEYRGIRLKHIYSPKNKGLEAIIHTFLGVMYARRAGADILHLHAVGPALLTPFARLLGLKVIFTNHGPDYDRDKWGGFASTVLRLGEKMGGLFANEVIVISEVIRNIIRTRCQRDSHLIYNGVELPELKPDHDYLDELGVEPGNYILAVARLVPEKGLHDLLEAFGKSHVKCKLVIAGDSDHEDQYSRQLKATAANNPNVVMTGYITGKRLEQVFTHAKLFILPSYHEGLPIALLEALSYGLLPLVSDIPANLEVKLDDKYYFTCKDTAHLAEKMEELTSLHKSGDTRQAFREFVKNKYNWDAIASQTADVYQNLATKKHNPELIEGHNKP